MRTKHSMNARIYKREKDKAKEIKRDLELDKYKKYQDILSSSDNLYDHEEPLDNKYYRQDSKKYLSLRSANKISKKHVTPKYKKNPSDKHHVRYKPGYSDSITDCVYQRNNKTELLTSSHYSSSSSFQSIYTDNKNRITQKSLHNKPKKRYKNNNKLKYYDDKRSPVEKFAKKRTHEIFYECDSLLTSSNSSSSSHESSLDSYNTPIIPESERVREYKKFEKKHVGFKDKMSPKKQNSNIYNEPQNIYDQQRRNQRFSQNIVPTHMGIDIDENRDYNTKKINGFIQYPRTKNGNVNSKAMYNRYSLPVQYNIGELRQITLPKQHTVREEPTTTSTLLREYLKSKAEANQPTNKPLIQQIPAYGTKNKISYRSSAAGFPVNTQGNTTVNNIDRPPAEFLNVYSHGSRYTDNNKRNSAIEAQNFVNINDSRYRRDQNISAHKETRCWSNTATLSSKNKDVRASAISESTV
ncbi:hypothetical protein BB561_004792 [Smittium simulii]|uniref:Uncharacterized protein n=1 Tax=Smittium simulii TaxID=133385 RepID=A0A2T9YE94_9FUNG|nr:hypothetical protein BB561_004792 [Smittium simulii]